MSAENLSRAKTALTTFDDEKTPGLEPVATGRPQRRRGRPRNSLGKIVETDLRVTLDDMAFLRAWIQGVELPQAARRFVPNAPHNDGRAARDYLRRLLQRMHIATKALRDQDRAQAFLAELDRMLAEASAPATPTATPAGEPTAPAPAPSPPTPQLPTLDEFAARFDPDMFSEAELQALYEEEFAPQLAGTGGQPDTAPAAAPQAQGESLDLHAKLAMVDWLAPLVAVEPSPDSPLGLWLGEELAQTLRHELGLTTLGQLARWVNLKGPRWFDAVPGLGRNRAGRLLAWLWRHEDRLEVRLRSRVGLRARQITGHMDPAGTALVPQNAVLDVPSESPLTYALVPLDQLYWPQDLLGEQGEFRSPTRNTYRASNDREALYGWVRKHVEAKSLNTQEISRRAIERLVLWALLERRCALSSLASDDLVQFTEFLYDPPPHWCSQERVMRIAEEWRPLRGALSAVAVRQIIGVVKQMFADWHAAGYLYANAAAGLSYRRRTTALQLPAPSGDAKAEAMGMDVMGRSLAEQDLQAMRRTLDEMPDTATKRRLRAILALYLDVGLRRSEIKSLTLGKISPVRLRNELTAVKKIEVIGKGEKKREVPIMPSTIEALEAHYEDRIRLAQQGKLPGHFETMSRDETPLLSILRVVRESGAAGPGVSPADAPRTQTRDGRLHGATVYNILKEFFRQVANRNDLVDGQAAFLNASTHWLRHTFAHRVLAAGSSLTATQALLGHSNINTTAIYVKADMDERVRAIAAVKPVF